MSFLSPLAVFMGCVFYHRAVELQREIWYNRAHMHTITAAGGGKR